MAGIAPELAVRKGSLLERAERLHPLVRQPEQSQPQNAEDDHEQGSADEGDEQLGVDAGRQPSHRPDERVVGRAQQPAFRTTGCWFLLRDAISATSAQIFSTAVLPTKFVISQRFSTPRQVEVAGRDRRNLPGLHVDEVALEVERAAISVDRDLELVRGMVGQPLRLGLECL